MDLRLLRNVSSDIGGAAVVEGAILFPILFVLVFGVFEFSWYFYEQHRVSSGIRDAARYVARSNNLIWTSINTAPTIPTAVKTGAENLASTGDPSQVCSSGTEPTCRVTGWLTSTVTISDPVLSAPCIAPDYCQGGATHMYTVNASTLFTPNSLGFLGFLKLGPFRISVDHTERLVPTCCL